MKNDDHKAIEASERSLSDFHSGETPVHTSKKIFDSPFHLFIITVVSIFIAEAIVMFVLSMLPQLSVIEEAILDSLLLLFIVFPILYFFILNPLRLHINERKRVEEILHELSLTDDLTGLSNRRGFFTLAQQELKIANRMIKGVSLVFADLDNLKNINDSFGHQEGDKVLIEAANILKKTFREADIIARIGGDEFVLFQIGNSGITMDKINERVQTAIHKYNANADREYTYSISFGIAFCEPEGSYSLDELLAQADKSMYEQKRNKQRSLP